MRSGNSLPSHSCSTSLRRIRVLNPFSGIVASTADQQFSAGQLLSSICINDFLICLIYDFCPNIACPRCLSILLILGELDNAEEEQERQLHYSVLVSRLVSRALSHLDYLDYRHPDWSDWSFIRSSCLPVESSSCLVEGQRPCLTQS